MNQFSFTIIGFFFLVFMGTLLYAVIKLAKLYKKRLSSEEKDWSQVGFVVNTFHELVAKLKEKEKELETLKNKAEDRASSIGLYNENILQSVPSGVVSFDDQLKVTKINAAAMKILDLRSEDVAGKSYDEVFAEPAAGLIGRRETVERTEFVYVTRNGRRLWLGMNMSPLLDGERAVIGQILVFTDITELKALQSQMELRDRLATLGEMSAGIAHEFRNPMAVISGYTKLLEKRVDVQLRPAVEAIAGEVSAMDRIITDFLSFAKPAELIKTDVDMTEVIQACIGAVRDPGRVNIVFAAAPLPMIRGDEVLLRQAIANLLQNAVEAMPDGGEVLVETGVERGRLKVSVKDRGHGIPGGIRDRVFLPFFTTKEKGTGLGLSIVHKIVVSHGGSIGLETGDTGTTFMLQLPLTP